MVSVSLPLPPKLQVRRSSLFISKIVLMPFSSPTIQFYQMMPKMERMVDWDPMGQMVVTVKLEWTVDSSTAIKTLMMVGPVVPIPVRNQEALMGEVEPLRFVPM
jgi:hypothetical protein